MLVGGNPFTTSAIYALIHKLEKDGGVWFAKGGTNRLVAGMVALFERLGGTLRLGDPVASIETLGDRATGVVTQSGWRGEAEAVASNGDVMHTYRDLLKGSRSAQRTVRGLEKKSMVAVAVRRPFRGQGHVAGHPASHDPVRPAL